MARTSKAPSQLSVVGIDIGKDKGTELDNNARS